MGQTRCFLKENMRSARQSAISCLPGCAAYALALCLSRACRGVFDRKHIRSDTMSVTTFEQGSLRSEVLSQNSERTSHLLPTNAFNKASRNEKQMSGEEVMNKV